MGRSAFGVVGGSFDPVHWGHLLLADRVRQALGLRRVMLLPAAAPPHKPQASLAPAADRAAMVRLAVADVPGLEICTVEIDRGGVGYTIDTMRTLRGAGQEQPLFVLGSDALISLPSWRDWRDLLAEFDLVAVDRPAAALEAADESLGLPGEILERIVRLLPRDGRVEGLEQWKLGRGGRIFHLPLDALPISASEIRRRAAGSLTLTGLVPVAVARYIQQRRLYQEDDR